MDLGSDFRVLHSIMRGDVTRSLRGEGMVYPYGDETIVRAVIAMKGSFDWRTETIQLDLSLGAAHIVGRTEDTAVEVAQGASARVIGRIGVSCRYAEGPEEIIDGYVVVPSYREDLRWLSAPCQEAREAMRGRHLLTEPGVVE